MRRLIVMAVVLLMLPALAAAQTTSQTTTKLGVGGFAGLSIPVVQDDQESGTEFGLRVRYGLGTMFVLEPYVSFVKWGGPDEIEGITWGIDGSKVTSFGVEATLGNSPGKIGLLPFLFAGAGSYKVKNDDTGYDQSKIGFSGGLGLGFGLSPQLALDFRGKLMVAPQKEGGSKKALGVTAGLNFNFGAK